LSSAAEHTTTTTTIDPNNKSSSTSTTRRRSKTRKKDKTNPNLIIQIEKPEKEEEEGQSQKIKLHEPIIYDLNVKKNQENTQRADDDNENNNSFKKDQERINNDAKEITNHFLEFHKNMIDTYNSIFSQILQNKFDSSWDIFTNIEEQFTNYQKEMKNMYTGFIINRDISLKLIDNIITENLDTFIQTIELTQKFYKDIIESYANCIIKNSTKNHS
jgi:hypothetical protein